jgi:electron transport complex protein RnfE
MGIATTVILTCSNIVISALRKIIPDSVRIPSYIVVIASFVSIVQMLMHAYLPDLYEMLGVYLALIVVNCILLGRAEMFARKNPVFDSALDGLGMGLGFILTLFVMSSIREIFGSGSFAGMSIPVLKDYCVPILSQTPGGFFVFGCLIALSGRLHKTGKKPEISCSGCPSASICGKDKCAKEDESK